MRMYDDQCKVDRDGGDSDASSCEQTTGRDSVHSPIGPATSPLKFNRSRGKNRNCNYIRAFPSLVKSVLCLFMLIIKT